jgi:hypothetical protein
MSAASTITTMGQPFDPQARRRLLSAHFAP